MINLNAYGDDSFVFYSAIVEGCKARKNRPDFKQELRSLNDQQKACFVEYDEQFEAKNLQTLTPVTYSQEERNDLRSLYNYQKKKIEKLRLLLTQHPITKRQLNTCQNCTINEVDTLDHLVPKEEFAEFSVHPKNLFPCCTTCNRIKNDMWRTEGQCVFLNLYIDPLPEEQFLFVSFDEDWLPEFSIQNIYNIDPLVYQVIESHYQRLNLLERFKRSCHEAISELEATIKSQSTVFSTGLIRQFIFEQCAEMKTMYGYNHWKTILKETLAAQDGFIQDCIGGTA